MKKEILICLFLLTITTAFSQKVLLNKSDTALIVVVKDSAALTEAHTITLSFTLSGSATSIVVIPFTLEPTRKPSAFSAFTGTVTIEPADWPSSKEISKTVTKTVTLTTQSVKKYDGESVLYIVPVINSANTAFIIQCDTCNIAVHLNDKGKIKEIDSSEVGKDTSNTPKLDMAFYTDFLGIDDDRPNGLYQIEAGFKVPLNRHLPQKIKDDYTKFYGQPFRSFLVLLNFNNLENILNTDAKNNSSSLRSLDDSSIINRIDTTVIKKPDGTDSSVTTTFYAQNKLVNSFDIYRWASFSAKVKLNLLALRWKNHKFYFDFSAGWLRTPVNDSVAGKTVQVNSIIYGPGIYYESNFSLGNPVFNVRFIGNYYFLKMISNDFTQINAPIFDYNYRSPDYKTYEKTKDAQIGDVSLRVSYLYNANSAEKVDNGNQVFARFGYSWQFPKINGQQFHNDNMQIQLGAVFDIGTIFKKPTAPKESTASGR